MQKLLIDTDPGQDIDDLLALLFALRRPELEVLGITTVTWPSQGRARLVKRLLRYLGKERIPVAAGIQLPFRPVGEGELAKQYDLANSMNHRAFAEPEDPRDDPGTLDAVELMARTLEGHAPGEVVLACLAPLTNIACLLRRHPDLAGRIAGIALMGGEVTDARREHNIAWDYNASDVVLRSGIPLYMGTWSVTRQFSMTMDECAPFDQSPHPVHQALARAIRDWHPAQNWKPGPVMYDIFPLIHAFRQDLYTLEAMPVRVETHDPEALGRTVVEEGAPVIQVTTAMDARAVHALFFETVFG